MEQKDRLDILVERFKADSARYRNIDSGRTADEKRVTLRALMNIRMPRPMDGEAVRIQDEYLQERAKEKGIVDPADIPVCPRDPSIAVWQGDITRLAADAIVNAANSQMLGCFVPGHGCIDNAIHTFAGVQLRAECAEKMAQLKAKYGQDYEQPTAVPMLTKGYNLPAKHVVHIVGPIAGGFVTEGLEEDLAACYSRTLDLCRDNGLKTVAFCCISTGVFGFPAEPAARIAVRTVRGWLAANPGCMDKVIFNVFKDADKALYEALLR
ncbi:MAG: protein-ADP-ribose hydrolase [Firmicutes bacterium]|nr:protein-ADP-ribose hydrolase [Bacillota bacterium]